MTQENLPQMSNVLVDDLGQKLLEMKGILKMLKGTAIHTRETAKCLELQEVAQHMRNLEASLNQAYACVDEPTVKEWMADQLNVPF